MLSITTKFGTVVLNNNVKIIATSYGLRIEVKDFEFISRRILRVLGVEYIVECSVCNYTLYDAGYAELNSIDCKYVRGPMMDEKHMTTISISNCDNITVIEVHPENFDININLN